MIELLTIRLELMQAIKSIKYLKVRINVTAKGILDARDLHPDSSLADLYDPLTMPPELLKAHKANDKAVMEAYEFDIKKLSEVDWVAKLMRMYQELVKIKGKQ